jgi:general secretion pathway protein G
MVFPFKIENFLSKTLLFLITTILILIILVLGLIVYNETAAIRHENIIKTQLSIKSVITVIEEYKKDRGEYPKSLDQLKGIYITKIPQDIWGNPYIYEYFEDTNSFRISTLGSDNAPGGEQDQRDFDNYTDWNSVN